MQRLGIMGGTFDPIHNGHLAAAEAARLAFALEKVIFVPTGIPPHKSGRITPGSERLAMTEAAVGNNPYFMVSDIEVTRPDVSYTIDTIAYFNRTYGAKVEIFFITGADAILEILSWKDVRQLMELCRFIAVTRPGYANGGLRAEIANLPLYIQNRVMVLEVPGMKISSTDVRSMVSRGQSIRNLVPGEVAAYIQKYNLYT